MSSGGRKRHQVIKNMEGNFFFLIHPILWNVEWKFGNRKLYSNEGDRVESNFIKKLWCLISILRFKLGCLSLELILALSNIWGQYMCTIKTLSSSSENFTQTKETE